MTARTEIGFGRKVRWWNLRQNKCPKCSKDLLGARMTEDSITCPCGFFISMDKYRELVSSLNQQDVDSKLDQMEKERGEW